MNSPTQMIVADFSQHLRGDRVMVDIGNGLQMYELGARSKSVFIDPNGDKFYFGMLLVDGQWVSFRIKGKR